MVVVQRVHEVQHCGQQQQPQCGEAGPTPPANAQMGDAVIGLALRVCEGGWAGVNMSGEQESSA